jgi:hypothetical protein
MVCSSFGLVSSKRQIGKWNEEKGKIYLALAANRFSSQITKNTLAIKIEE